MDYQKAITKHFKATARRDAQRGESIFFDGSLWEYNGSEWWTSNATRVLESKDFHIRSLEAMLKKACKFNLSPKKKHDVTIERKKEKDKPFYYIIKNGFNNRISRLLKPEYEPIASQITEQYKQRTEFMSLVDAFSVAEKYIDMKNDESES